MRMNEFLNNLSSHRNISIYVLGRKIDLGNSTNTRLLLEVLDVYLYISLFIKILVFNIDLQLNSSSSSMEAK